MRIPNPLVASGMRRLCLVSAVSLALVGCEGDKPADKTAKVPATTGGAQAAAPDASAALESMTGVVLERIRSLEREKDVTCWTSFRQLDFFIATKQYSDFATLAKGVQIAAYEFTPEQQQELRRKSPGFEDDPDLTVAFPLDETMKQRLRRAGLRTDYNDSLDARG